MTRSTIALLALLTACGDDADDQPIELAIPFAPTVGSAPFACGQTYPAMGAEATTITPRDFRFYVHDVQLVKTDGSFVPVELTPDDVWQYENVALLDFEDFTGGCQDGTPETNTTLRGIVPPGTYDGVAFTIGVPDAMNHVDLTTQPAPLNLTGLWWDWKLGHVFMAIVTRADITTPQPKTNDHYVHVGSIDCTGDPAMGETVTCAKPNRPYIELRGFDPTSDTITADFGAVIDQSSLASSAGCHSFMPATCTVPFDRVGLSWATGMPTPETQKLFRIEP
jgi:uncharacterized repeat protein (TIGR04052 family)